MMTGRSATRPLAAASAARPLPRRERAGAAGPTPARRPAPQPARAARRTRTETAFHRPSEVALYRTPTVSYGLVILVVLMLLFGLVMLFSASMNQGIIREQNSTHYITRQIIFTVAGLVLILPLTQLRLVAFNRPRYLVAAYLVVTVLLVLVLSPVGIRVNDHRRWLPVPLLSGMTFQPTELAKLVVVFGGAAYYSQLEQARRRGRFRSERLARALALDFALDFGIPLGALGLWFVLIASQSHLSAILIMAILMLIVMLCAGIRPRSWLVALGVGVILLTAVSIFVLRYGEQLLANSGGDGAVAKAMRRLAIFLDKPEVSADASYQSRQALIAIGSGGWRGSGLGLGVQKMSYLPEAHNDYIFSIVCEELGFLGGSAVVLLFTAFLVGGLKIALRMRSTFSRCLATGFTGLIVVQALLSIAVNLKLFIPTGISLPFFSYGGTSNLFFLVAIGMLLNVSKYGRRPQPMLKGVAR